MKIFVYLYFFVWLVLMSSVLCEKPATCGQTTCPQYLRPVCATNGRTRKTFSNQCAVRLFNECSSDEKYNILRKGPC